MITTGTSAFETTSAMAGSRCRPQTSLTIVTPRSSAQAAELDHRRQHYRKARHFLLCQHRRSATIGPSRLRADVDDVGALPHHLLGLGDSVTRIHKAATVEKGIRRAIEDAHHERTPEVQQTRKPRRWGIGDQCLAGRIAIYAHSLALRGRR